MSDGELKLSPSNLPSGRHRGRFSLPPFSFNEAAIGCFFSFFLFFYATIFHSNNRKETLQFRMEDCIRRETENSIRLGKLKPTSVFLRSHSKVSAGFQSHESTTVELFDEENCILNG